MPRDALCRSLHPAARPARDLGGRATARRMDTRKALAIVALVAAEGRPFARDELAAMFWPEADDEAARGALRRTLSTRERRSVDQASSSTGRVSGSTRRPRGWTWPRLDRLAASDRLADLRGGRGPARGPFLAGFAGSATVRPSTIGRRPGGSCRADRRRPPRSADHGASWPVAIRSGPWKRRVGASELDALDEPDSVGLIEPPWAVRRPRRGHPPVPLARCAVRPRAGRRAAARDDRALRRDPQSVRSPGRARRAASAGAAARPPTRRPRP